jgi:hypothetical protein
VNVVGGAIEVACGACGLVNALAATPPDPAPVAQTRVVPPSGVPSAAPVPPEPGLAPVKCPKCGHRQHGETACDKCGLVFANVRPGRKPWERVPPDKRVAVQRADELWVAITVQPSDAAAHAAFVEFCKTKGISDVAAMRYRHWVSDHPSDAVSKHYMQQSIQDAHALAQAMIGPNSNADGFKDGVKRARQIFVAVVLSVTILLFLFVLKLLSDGGGV